MIVQDNRANHYDARIDSNVEYWIRGKLGDLEKFDGISIYLGAYLFLQRTISTFAPVGDRFVLLFLVTSCFRELLNPLANRSK